MLLLGKIVTIRGGFDGNQAPNDTSKKRKKKKKNKEKNEFKNETEAPVPDQTTSNPVVDEVVRHQNDFYKVLGLEKTPQPSERDIQKAYRKRCLQTHPDKTSGDRRAFDLVSEAYHVLSDTKKRAIYDRYGSNGLKASMEGAPGSAEDIFRSFFGDRFTSASTTPRNPSLRYQLQVSLEDMYTGRQQDITIATQKSHQKTVHVLIPRGAIDGQRIVLSGEMDLGDATTPPGDVVFILQQQAHPHFTRKGYDLAMRMKVSLADAIRGRLYRKVRHLDGRVLVLEYPSDGNNIIHTNHVFRMKGEGMPKNEQGTEYGDLYVQCEVEQVSATNTEHLTPEERDQLCVLLDKIEGKATESDVPEDSMKHILTRVSPSDFGRASGVPKNPQNDDFAQSEFDEPFSPFGRQRFYWSSTGTNPFFGIRRNYDNDDGSDVQCQQM